MIPETNVIGILLESNLFMMFVGVATTELVHGVKAVILNVSDIWQNYLKHANYGALPEQEKKTIQEDKWYILGKYLINDTAHSLWNYPHKYVWLTNHYVIYRCGWKQICLRCELWWLRKLKKYHEWKYEQIKRKEYAYNVKRVCKSIDEFNKQQQALLDKKIEHFWERGWNEIRRIATHDCSCGKGQS